MSYRSIGAVAVSSIMFAACGPATEEEPPGSLAQWVSENAQGLATEAASFDDLEFLRPLLEGKRIVQLGENAHGIREYNLLKTRIVRFLHQELGYDVLAFESSVYQCYDSNLTAPTAPAAITLYRCAFGVWHTEGVLDLFEYLAETQGGDRPIALAGFDVQPIGRNKDDRPEFLASLVASIDAEYAVAVTELDTDFLEVYTGSGRERRAYFRTDEGQQMAADYDRLAAFINENRTEIIESPDKLDRLSVEVGRRTAVSMAWYIRQQSSPNTQGHIERRDEGMAENLISIVEEQYPGRKVIVWGHNFHLRHDNFAIPPHEEMFPDVAARTMGSWLRERFGDQMYTVGLYAFRGQAMNNSGEIFEIEAAEPGSVEALWNGVATEAAVFVDVSRWGQWGRMPWMDQPVTARFDGTRLLSLVLDDQYDAVIVVGDATPRTMLY